MPALPDFFGHVTVQELLVHIFENIQGEPFQFFIRLYPQRQALLDHVALDQFEGQVGNSLVRVYPHGRELSRVHKALQTRVVLTEKLQQSLHRVYDTMTQAARAIAEGFIIQGQYEVILHALPVFPAPPSARCNL